MKIRRIRKGSIKELTRLNDHGVVWKQKRFVFSPRKVAAGDRRTYLMIGLSRLGDLFDSALEIGQKRVIMDTFSRFQANAILDGADSLDCAYWVLDEVKSQILDSPVPQS